METVSTKLEEKSRKIRKKIVEMCHRTNASHIGGSLSCTDILATLYFSIMDINPKKPLDENRDRLILSKGHAGHALYATLAEKGFFPEKKLLGFYADGSSAWGHPSLGCVPGVEATTGSLGHGLPIGVGMALAAKMDAKKYRVFVVLSDGECDEGSTWEAAMSASHHKLENLVAIVDYNKLQAFGKTNQVVNLEPLADKWKAFGFAVKEVDGHNVMELFKALKAIPFEKGKPSLLIAHTVKGKGVSFMENRLEWHYKSPDAQQLKQAIKELDAGRKAAGESGGKR